MSLEISVHDLAAALAAGEPVYLVDVREEWEHAVAALPGSVLVPLGELAERAGELEPPTGALVVVYCHHGVRSRYGVAVLEAAGLTGARSLAGGIDCWSWEIDPSMPRY